MEREELRELLEHLHDKYNRVEFIEPDPISIPHSFSDRDDREEYVADDAAFEESGFAIEDVDLDDFADGGEEF